MVKIQNLRVVTHILNGQEVKKGQMPWDARDEYLVISNTNSCDLQANSLQGQHQLAVVYSTRRVSK